MKKVKMRSKRIIALILALTMAFGTYITAFAEWKQEGPFDQNWVDGKYEVEYLPNAPVGQITGTMGTSKHPYNYDFKIKIKIFGKTFEKHYVNDVPAKLSLNQYQRLGYKFMGWSLEAGSNEIYSKDNDALYHWAPDKNNKLKLYAVWQLKGNYSINTKTPQHYTYVKNAPQSYTVDWASPKPTQDITITYYNTNGVKVENPTDAGTYTVKINVKGNNDYNEFNDEISGGLVIDKADYSISDASATNVKYGESSTGFNKDNIAWSSTKPQDMSKVQISYRLNGSSNPFSPNIPTAVGSYDIKVTVDEDDNSNFSDYDSEAVSAQSQELLNCYEVRKADCIISSASQSPSTYDGNTHSFLKSSITWSNGTPASVTIGYRLNETENAFITEGPTAAGKYDIQVTVKDDTNYSDYDSENDPTQSVILKGAFVISRAEYSLKIASDAKTAGTYNASPIPYDSDAKLTWGFEKPKKINISYIDQKTKVSSNTAPTDAGTYDVVISVDESDNFNKFNPITIVSGLVIDQAIPTPKIPQLPDVTYDQNMSLSFVSFQKNYEATLDTSSVEGTWSWVDGTTKLTVGTHTYKATFTPTGKYANNFKSITADVPLTVKEASTFNDSKVPQASLPKTDSTGGSSNGSGSTATTALADSKVAKAGNPDTSDANSEMLLTSLAILGLSAAGVTAVISKKKKEDM